MGWEESGYKPLPKMTYEEWCLLEKRAAPSSEIKKALAPREYQLYVIRKAENPPLTESEIVRRTGLKTANVKSVFADARKKLPGLSFRENMTANGGGRGRSQPMASGRVSSEAFLRELEPAALKIARQLSNEQKIGKATLAQLGQTLRGIIEMRQILSGEPTQIIAHEQRGDALDMAKWLVSELQRRGMQVKGIDQRTGEPRIEKNITPSTVDA